MDKDIIFPIVYELRIIYNGDADEGIKKISKLLSDLTINLEKGFVKPGGKKSLVRLGFNITLYSKEQMDSLYNNLNTIPEIKWAT